MLQVYLFNVGQGDNILIKLPSGSYGIIDFFYDPSINYEKEPPALTFLKQVHQLGEHVRIKFLHLSHYHFDHINGLERWIEWVDEEHIEVETIWLPGSFPTETVIHNITKALRDTKLIGTLLHDNPELEATFNKISHKYNKGVFTKLEQFLHQANRDAQFLNSIRRLSNVCPTPVEVYCLAPTATRAINFAQQDSLNLLKVLFTPHRHSKTDGNDISAVILMIFGSFKLLFGGDAKKESIEESIKSLKAEPYGISFQANFVKIFHHGAKYSSSLDIWKEILYPQQSTHIAISAGVRYMHPDQETIEHIKSIAALKEHNNTYIYSTNYEYLKGRGQSNIESVIDEKRLNWQFPKKNTVDKITEKARVLDTIPGIKPIQLDQEGSRFLGYCFEFNSTDNNISVSKLIT